MDRDRKKCTLRPVCKYITCTLLILGFDQHFDGHLLEMLTAKSRLHKWSWAVFLFIVESREHQVENASV